MNQTRPRCNFRPFGGALATAPTHATSASGSCSSTKRPGRGFHRRPQPFFCSACRSHKNQLHDSDSSHALEALCEPSQMSYLCVCMHAWLVCSLCLLFSFFPLNNWPVYHLFFLNLYLALFFHLFCFYFSCFLFNSFLHFSIAAMKNKWLVSLYLVSFPIVLFYSIFFPFLLTFSLSHTYFF